MATEKAAKRNLHDKRKALKAKLDADPSNAGLKARIKRLSKRIMRGDDRPNETLEQRKKRLVKRAERKGENPKLNARIDKLTARIGGEPKEPPPPAMPNAKRKIPPPLYGPDKLRNQKSDLILRPDARSGKPKPRMARPKTRD